MVNGAITKVASRCNLNCTYCYMYNVGDDSYRRQPKRMDPLVRDAFLQRVLQHSQQYGLQTFDFIFHGGEPLLAGKRFFDQFVRQAHTVLDGVVEARFFLQTNAVLLDDNWCRHLGNLGIRLGISLDGPAPVNDRYRLDHQGQSSFSAAERGLHYALQSSWLVNRPGVLTVVDPTTNPLTVYDYLRSTGVTAIDFLLPDATFDQPPPRQPGTDTPYADWLIVLFNVWFGTPKRPHIRLFDQLLSLIVGQEITSELWGKGLNEFIVVETDGGIEPTDMLKICGPDFTKIGANVRTHQLAEALNSELMTLYRHSHQRLCDTCTQCPIVDVCGGGFLPHRYHRQNGFDNPSVYCRDLLKLITHIQNQVCVFLPEGLRQEIGLEPLSYAKALQTFAAQ